VNTFLKQSTASLNLRYSVFNINWRRRTTN